jgi:DNA-binding NarL/FixJ family response regulator
MFSVAIIDDSPVIQERLKDRLKTINGIGSVYHAENKADALTVIENRNPNIVILDLQLPDGTGIEILEQIKRGNKNMLIIVLTNFPYSVLRRRCEDFGANYFFDKSTEFHEVVNVIESITQVPSTPPSIDQAVSNLM